MLEVVVGFAFGLIAMWVLTRPEPAKEAVACWSWGNGQWMLELDTGERLIRRREGLLTQWRYYPSMEPVKPFATSWLEEERLRLTALDAEVGLQ